MTKLKRWLKQLACRHSIQEHLIQIDNALAKNGYVMCGACCKKMHKLIYDEARNVWWPHE